METAAEGGPSGAIGAMESREGRFSATAGDGKLHVARERLTRERATDGDAATRTGAVAELQGTARRGADVGEAGAGGAGLTQHDADLGGAADAADVSDAGSEGDRARHRDRAGVKDVGGTGQRSAGAAHGERPSGVVGAAGQADGTDVEVTPGGGQRGQVGRGRDGVGRSAFSVGIEGGDDVGVSRAVGRGRIEERVTGDVGNEIIGRAAADHALDVVTGCRRHTVPGELDAGQAGGGGQVSRRERALEPRGGQLGKHRGRSRGGVVGGDGDAGEEVTGEIQREQARAELGPDGAVGASEGRDRGAGAHQAQPARRSAGGAGDGDRSDTCGGARLEFHPTARGHTQVSIGGIGGGGAAEHQAGLGGVGIDASERIHTHRDRAVAGDRFIAVIKPICGTPNTGTGGLNRINAAGEADRTDKTDGTDVTIGPAGGQITRSRRGSRLGGSGTSAGGVDRFDDVEIGRVVGRRSVDVGKLGGGAEHGVGTAARGGA